MQIQQVCTLNLYHSNVSAISKTRYCHKKRESKTYSQPHTLNTLNPNTPNQMTGQNPEDDHTREGEAGAIPGEPPTMVAGALSYARQGIPGGDNPALEDVSGDSGMGSAMSNSHAGGSEEGNVNKGDNGQRGGFLHEEVRGTKAELDVIDGVLTEAYGHEDPLGSVAQRFLAHVYFCQTRFSSRYGGNGVPVGYHLLKKACREADGGRVPDRTEDVWGPLQAAGALEVVPYVYRQDGKGKSRRFRLSGTFMTRLRSALEKGIDTKTHYNLVNGARLRRQRQTKLTYDGSHSWEDRSQVIYETLKALQGQRDLVNKGAVEGHLGRLKTRADRAEKRYDNLKAKGAGQEQLVDARQRLEQVRGRYDQDLRIWREIKGQGLDPAPDQAEGIFQYKTAYEVQEASGRLTMTAGLQSASKEMKAAAAQGISGYRNYDIASSQTEGLRQEMEHAAREGANVDLSVLGKYPGKDTLAETHGIGRERWKRPEHAVKFGAGFSHDTYQEALSAGKGRVLSRIEGEDGEPRFHLLDRLDHESGKMAWERAVHNELPTMARVACGWAQSEDVPLSDPEDAYKLLRSVFEAMAVEIDRWREWLLEVHWSQEGQPGGPNGYYVENPCGLPFSIHDERLEEGGEPSRYNQKAAYATSRLQGLEAAYMHALAVLAEEYDFEFLRNEHDGAVVLGEIPAEARKRAREMSGFERARLEEKPFGSKTSNRNDSPQKDPQQKDFPGADEASGKADLGSGLVENLGIDNLGGRPESPPVPPTKMQTPSTLYDQQSRREATGGELK